MARRYRATAGMGLARTISSVAGLLLTINGCFTRGLGGAIISVLGGKLFQRAVQKREIPEAVPPSDNPWYIQFVHQQAEQAKQKPVLNPDLEQRNHTDYPPITPYVHH